MTTFTHNMKKNYIIFFIIISVGCGKITPGNFNRPELDKPDTTNWYNQYSDGGVIPTSAGYNNGLVGTTWVLTQWNVPFAPTVRPYDTLRFVSNSNYTINSGNEKPYNLTSGVASTNKTLNLYFFTSFGGSHYSGEVGSTFITDSIINNAEFKNIQNTTSKIKAWFKRI